jgi:hypothetical protein
MRLSNAWDANKSKDRAEQERRGDKLGEEHDACLSTKRKEGGERRKKE